MQDRKHNLCATSPRQIGKRNYIFIRKADETFGTWHLRRGGDVDTVKLRSNLSTNDGGCIG